MPGKTARVVLQGLRRIRVTKITGSRPYFQAQVECVDEADPEGPEVRDLVGQVIDLLHDLVQFDPRYSEELVKVAQLNRESGSRCADQVAHMVQFGYADKRRLMETAEAPARLQLLVELLRREIARAWVTGEVQTKAAVSIDRSQREALLREQLDVIRRELEELDPADAEVADLAGKVESAGLPPMAAEEAMRAVQRLRDPDVRALEGSSVRSYVDWVLELPWEKEMRERFDLRRAQRLLDERYFGRENAKKRLLEYLAVRKLGGSKSLPLLAIVGPPGTGRTSLAQTVAQVMNRPFVHIPMSGIHDAAEIQGQTRTTVAARPGRILEGVREAGVRNPIILIDDVHRLHPGGGETMVALLEALDPVINCRFLDRYLGVPFDLSQVLFVVTANMEEEIPDALHDYMTLIELAGYTERVKLSIARKSLWPQALEEHGLAERGIRLTDAALRRVIHEYTQEAGVRDLKAKLETVCRRLAVVVAKSGARKLSVDARNVEKYLGKPIHTEELLPREPQLGAAMGLAWTEFGGDLLPVEALLMPGEGRTTLTGLLGEVLQESVEAALSYVRSRAEELKIPSSNLKKKDLHIHFPEGAIPKDGPSAGIAVATTIASLLSGRPVRHDVAMTGEISLRGRVLPVGGVREKVLGAYRAGIRQVILPKGNESDLEEVPREVRSKMNLHLVGEVAEVFKLALMVKREPRPAKAARKATSGRKPATRKKRKQADKRHSHA
jgi:ATP-dependent Lon protease